MNDRHAHQRSLLAALGHDSRYRIALCLLEGDRCVGELATAIGLSQSCTTRHVQALERAGFVRSRRNGKRVLVAIEHRAEGIADLVRWLATAAVSSADERAAGTVAGGRYAPEQATRGVPRSRVTSRRRPARAGGERAAARESAREPSGSPKHPLEPAAQERSHAEAPRSGKSPAPPEPPPSRQGRFLDPIEDFLL